MTDHSSSSSIHDGNWYILLAGLQAPADPITLAPGISLRPLAEPISVFDLAAAGAAGFRAWAVLEPFASACQCEIESARDAAILPGYDTLNRAWLASALMVLRGFTRQLPLACSAYSWSRIAGHQNRTSGIFEEQLRKEGPHRAVFASKRELPPFQGTLLDFHVRMVTNTNAQTGAITRADLEWIQTHFQVFNELAAASERFRFALEAATDWRFTTDVRSAISRLWSGIEALFGITSELVYRISLLSASLLAARGEARKHKFRDVKVLYGLRSKVVHGEALSASKLANALDGSFSLLSDLLLLTIDKGHVIEEADFDDAVFA